MQIRNVVVLGRCLNGANLDGVNIGFGHNAYVAPPGLKLLFFQF